MEPDDFLFLPGNSGYWESQDDYLTGEESRVLLLKSDHFLISGGVGRGLTAQYQCITPSGTSSRRDHLPPDSGCRPRHPAGGSGFQDAADNFALSDSLF